ncbi:MAG: adenylate cyclase [Flammeovirgaceae bacterium]|nr:adenylate cyclase [Flammeovirgaceae bacterium]MBE62304.1 adenylate cyclase [Flammeovirgaceae bacterium]HCX23698.1 adenylate cyclase [Cytophagales bacterium]|tara:strand:+ start:800 stop:1264 length:465 start_codon:yes stop_codon:yes gene_type:complete
MGLEIERKFLLKNSDWRKLVEEENLIKQGYLNSNAERTVRVRVKNSTAYLTIKGKSQNTVRQEFEYEIPLADAESMLKLCESPRIEKTRFIVNYEGKTWEIDEFEGENKGLAVAEIELTSEDESFDLPDWIGEEVSQDARYFNSSLIKKPFSSW